MFKFLERLKRKPKVADQPNPWTDIQHDCNWLPANDGKERVCGDCGSRRPA